MSHSARIAAKAQAQEYSGNSAPANRRRKIESPAADKTAQKFFKIFSCQQTGAAVGYGEDKAAMVGSLILGEPREIGTSIKNAELGTD
jgi:hypothetical protein